MLLLHPPQVCQRRVPLTWLGDVLEDDKACHLRRLNVSSKHGKLCKRLASRAGTWYADRETGSHVYSPLEEDAVALMADLSKNSGRGLLRVGDKGKILLVCRPANGCSILNHAGIKLIRFVMEVNMVLHTMPMDAEGDIRVDRFPMR